MSNWIIINGVRKLKQDSLSKINALKSSEEITEVVTQWAGHAKELAREASSKQANTITAVGGDGTIHEVINGIDLNGPVTLGIVPNGSGNDYIRSLKPGLNDVHFMRTRSNDQVEYCANILDVGFGGHVIQQLSKLRKKGFKGNLAYGSAILRAFFTFKKGIIKVEIDQEVVYEGKSLMTAVCKGKVFGYGIFINPNANPEDEYLYVTILGNVSLFDYVKYLKRLKAGKKIVHPEVFYLKGKHVHLRMEQNTAGEMDGELFECSNLNIELTEKKKVFLY